MTKFIKTTLAVGALALGVAESSAAFINGSLLMVGTGSASVAGGTTTVTPNSPFDVILPLGDYSGIPIGTDVTVFPFAYTGTGAGAVLVAPVVPEWTVTVGPTTFTFNLLALQSATFTPGNALNPLNSIAVSGVGI